MQNGDLKLVCNLEYRTRLFGNLHGALFLDAGNVWRWKDQTFDLVQMEETDPNPEMTAYMVQMLNAWFKDTGFKLSNLPRQMALGTGVGLRYDLGFLVVRVDWGLALHTPYDTGRSGYFNWGSFRDSQALHFAVGYPF
jgi:outer membrane translocation and assembly module TamA